MFVVEPTAGDEKLRQLLAEGHESPALDYKSTVDLSLHHDVVELVKDLAAMRAEEHGRYIVVGAADDGTPTDGLPDDRKAALFDGATLRGNVGKYLSEPLQLLAGVHVVDGHRYACIYVGPTDRGFEVLRIEGTHEKKTVFRRATSSFAGERRASDGMPPTPKTGYNASPDASARDGGERSARTFGRS